MQTINPRTISYIISLLRWCKNLNHIRENWKSISGKCGRTNDGREPSLTKLGKRMTKNSVLYHRSKLDDEYKTNDNFFSIDNSINKLDITFKFQNKTPGQVQFYENMALFHLCTQ